MKIAFLFLKIFFIFYKKVIDSIFGMGYILIIRNGKKPSQTKTNEVNTMTRKEKLAVIKTVMVFVRVELKAVNADILDIKAVEQICNTAHMRRITKKDISSIANVIQYARRQVEKMAVTDRTLEAITEIQQLGLWFCGKFNLSSNYLA